MTHLRSYLGLASAILLSSSFVSIEAQAAGRSVNCPADPATYTSIGAAVTASSAGDTIIVCPGIYPENVVVTVDHLRILADPSGTAKVVPGNSSLPGFQLNASHDTIQGFAISGFSAGIYVGAPYGQELISENAISGNVTGVSFNNSAQNQVQENRIIWNDQNGILDFYDLTLTKDSANAYEKNKIVYNAANGIYINTSSPASTYPRARIDENKIDNNSADGVLLNLSSYVEIDKNEMSFNGQDGIELIASTNNHIGCNEADHNGASITVCGPSEGAGNCTGIRIHSDSTGNVVEGNKAYLNLVWDAQDNSTGSSTAGTANRWRDDACLKDSPTGLCKF